MAGLLLASGCAGAEPPSSADESQSPDATAEAATATDAATDEASGTPAEVHERIGCGRPLDDSFEPEGYPGITNYPCTSQTDELRSTLVFAETEGTKQVYLAEMRELDEVVSGRYQLVDGDGLWVFWGTDPEMTAAAIDAGGSLVQPR